VRWCKDKWGLSWQITPRVLIDVMSDPDRAAAKRAFDAMMTMKKIDIATIEAARCEANLPPHAKHTSTGAGVRVRPAASGRRDRDSGCRLRVGLLSSPRIEAVTGLGWSGWRRQGSP
jgi:hypothetical protein